MFVSDELVFLHLQKAAGTRVVDVLARTLPGRVTPGHDPLRTGARGRAVAAAIRDPWDWYVSLWAYGAMGKGGVRGHVTQSHSAFYRQTLRAVATGRLRPEDAWRCLRRDRDRDPRAWAARYAAGGVPAEEAARFRHWLRAVLTSPGAGHLPGLYPALPLCGQVGFMSYRVLSLFVEWSEWCRARRRIRTPSDALDILASASILTHVLRCERLEADLDALLRTLGHVRRMGGRGDRSTEGTRPNRSLRRDFTEYYDAETVALVAQRDRLVVEAFGYRPPELTRATALTPAGRSVPTMSGAWRVPA
ncbi:MAG: hypothetical protein AAGB05_12760 [Pseudomonadota bacterium]